MHKRWWIQVFIIPNLRSLAQWLRMRDANSTGADDEAANAIDYALSRLEEYLNAPGE